MQESSKRLILDADKGITESVDTEIICKQLILK